MKISSSRLWVVSEIYKLPSEAIAAGPRAILYEERL